MNFKQVIITEFGGPEVMKVVKKATLPEPAAGEVRIKVQATSACFTNTMVRKGIYYGFRKKPPFPPGYDVVGVVDKVGMARRRATMPTCYTFWLVKRPFLWQKCCETAVAGRKGRRDADWLFTNLRSHIRISMRHAFTFLQIKFQARQIPSPSVVYAGKRPLRQIKTTMGKIKNRLSFCWPFTWR